MFFVLPLIAMCSVSVRKSDCNFVEEYVIPQMLMTWLRNSSLFVGVRYYSYSANELVRCNTGHNIAIPVRDEIKNGYSSEICGTVIRAVAFSSGDYPAINIYRMGKTGDIYEKLCFVEFNPEKEDGRRICIGTYCSEQDDTTYYSSYEVGEENEES